MLELETKLQPSTYPQKIDLRIDARQVSKDDENAIDIDIVNAMSKWESIKTEEQKVK